MTATTSTIPFPSYPNQNLVTTAETIVMVCGAPSTRGPSDQILITGTASGNTGASATQVTVRCRRGGVIGGATVGQPFTTNVTASGTYDVSFDFTDSPGEVAGMTYAITVQQTAATGNGLSNNVQGNTSVP